MSVQQFATELSSFAAGLENARRADRLDPVSPPEGAGVCESRAERHVREAEQGGLDERLVRLRRLTLSGIQDADLRGECKALLDAAMSAYDGARRKTRHGDDRAQWEASAALAAAVSDLLGKALPQLEVMSPAVESPQAPAADDSAYRPMSEFVSANGEFSTLKALDKVLSANKQIRQRKPSSQRREVHAGDLAAFLARRRKLEDEMIDNPRAVETVAGAAQRMAEEKQRKDQERRFGGRK